MLKRAFLAAAVILGGMGASVSAAQPCVPCYNQQWILVESPTFMRYNPNCTISWRKGPIRFETINGLCVMRRLTCGVTHAVADGVSGLTYGIRQAPEFVHGVLCPCHTCRSPYRRYSVFRVHRHIIGR